MVTKVVDLSKVTATRKRQLVVMGGGGILVQEDMELEGHKIFSVKICKISVGLGPGR